MALYEDVVAVPVGTQPATATGNGASFDASGYKQLGMVLNISAKTGTFTNYQFFLQGSQDGGTTWFGAASGTGAVLLLLTGGATDITTGAYYGGLTIIPAPLLRLAWTLAGGTNVTFTCRAALKN
jgi:hypothetical protein